MDYDPNDYYSSSGDEAAPVPTAGVEKKNKETKKPAKRAMTEAKLAQLKRAREAKARKRTERLSIGTAVKSSRPKPSVPPVKAVTPSRYQEGASHSDTEVEVVSVRAPKRSKPKRKKRIVIQQPESSDSGSDYEVEYVAPPRRNKAKQPPKAVSQSPAQLPAYTEAPVIEQAPLAPSLYDHQWEASRNAIFRF